MPRNTPHQYACFICSLLEILFFKFLSSAWREHDVYRVIQWCFVFVLHSGSRVFGPKTELEGFLLGRWSRVCCWRFREKQKKCGPSALRVCVHVCGRCLSLGWFVDGGVPEQQWLELNLLRRSWRLSFCYGRNCTSSYEFTLASRDRR